MNIGQINIGRNNVINNRPSWSSINSGRITSINNRWQNQIGGLHNWNNVHPNRAAYWAGWGRESTVLITGIIGIPAVFAATGGIVTHIDGAAGTMVTDSTVIRGDTGGLFQHIGHV